MILSDEPAFYLLPQISRDQSWYKHSVVEFELCDFKDHLCIL